VTVKILPMPIRKGVIPAAGLGTRFLPASKAVPKVLLPIVDRPIIQYAVEEMARAGITQICIVLSHGQGAIADHFAPAPELEAVLEKGGRTELLEEVRRTESLADIFYVQQHRPLGLGHAVLCAADFIDDEPFAVVLPETDAEGGFRAAEKIRRRIFESPFGRERSIPVTMSIGVACFPRAGTDQMTLLRAADVALYQAKARGKNRSIVYQPTEEGRAS